MQCYPVTKPIRSASPAAFEILTLQEAKHQLSIAASLEAHDAMILDYLTAAREAVEHDAMLVTATGTYTVKRTGWSSGNYFELPSSLRPVTSITSIVYVSTDGTSTTWSSAQYSLDTYTLMPTVKLAYDYSWPTLRGDINGITITAVAGYASADAIPRRVKDAARLHLSHSWHTFLGETKESDLAMKAYENVVNLLRQEIYA